MGTIRGGIPLSGENGRGIDRRTFLVGVVAGGTLAGCLTSPSDGGPPFDAHEMDGGAVFGPGLQDEREEAFYAGIVASSAAAGRFDRDAFPADADRQFLADTDFDEQFLGVVQVAGLNSSMELRVVDVAQTEENLTLVITIDDPEPHSDDRVISTLLVRLAKNGSAPTHVRVELSVGDRNESFTGGRVTPPE